MFTKRADGNNPRKRKTQPEPNSSAEKSNSKFGQILLNSASKADAAVHRPPSERRGNLAQF